MKTILITAFMVSPFLFGALFVWALVSIKAIKQDQETLWNNIYAIRKAIDDGHPSPFYHNISIPFNRNIYTSNSPSTKSIQGKIDAILKYFKLEFHTEQEKTELRQVINNKKK